MFDCFHALVMLIGAWIFLTAQLQASPLNYWTWINPQVNGNSLFSMAYGNGVYVAVGDWGTVQTSRDGVHWKNKSLPISDAFGAVTFGNGIFVAYLFEGGTAPSETAYTYLLTSPDGENWNVVFAQGHLSLYGRTDLLSKIFYTNGTFVAIGGNDSQFADEDTTWLLTSPDGTNWTTRIYQPGYPLFGITYAQNKFIAIGKEGQRLTSTNGTSWDNVLPADDGGVDNWVDIVYRDSRFIALGNTGHTNEPSYILTSSNGTDWNATGVTVTDYGFMRRLSVSNGKLLATGERGKTFVSDDATNWSALPLPLTNDTFDAEFIQGTCFLLGADGYILSGPDGQPWSVFPPRFQDLGMNTAQDFASDGKCLVTVGPGGFTAWSQDGQTWTKGTNASTEGLYHITYGAGKFIAVGDDQTIVMSTNGRSWQTVFSNPSTSTSRLLMGVAWNGSQFTAVGLYGYTVTSTNGVDWDLHQPTASFFWSVIAGNGLFVAIEGPNIVTSTNGIDWVLRGNSGGPIMRHGLYAQGKFVLAGDIGVVMTSTNGMDWTSNSVPFDGLLRKVAFIDGLFVTAGDGAAIFTSTNGADWQGIPLPAYDYVTGIGIFNDRVILGGNNGMLLQSDPVSGPEATIRGIEWLGNNRVRLDLLATPGATFQIQHATDLLNGWSSPAPLYSPLGRSTSDQILFGPIGFFRAPLSL